MIDQWKKGHKYWDHAWNPVVGCNPVSEGCRHCYAEEMCTRFGINGFDDGWYTPTKKPKAKPPVRRGVVFVGNMTDLFGSWNTDDEIVEWTHQPVYNTATLYLTKRAERMAKLAGRLCPMRCGEPFYGITAENQARFDERGRHFWDIYTKQFWWLSAEPLLGPIDLQKIVRLRHITNSNEPAVRIFRWVVVGAETGSRRRPCKLEWVEAIVEACRKWNVPVFVKQLDLNGKLVKDINKFPAHLQIRQVPWGATI
jgi:protein gp37